MSKKTEKMKLTDLLPEFQIPDSSNLTIKKFANSINLLNTINYIKIRHPVKTSSIIYVSGTDFYILTNIINYINSKIIESSVFDLELREKINEFILILKKIDLENNIKHDYKVNIEKHILYIL